MIGASTGPTDLRADVVKFIALHGASVNRHKNYDDVLKNRLTDIPRIPSGSAPVAPYPSRTPDSGPPTLGLRRATGLWHNSAAGACGTAAGPNTAVSNNEGHT